MGMIIGMMFVMFCLFNLLPCFIIFPPEVVAVCHEHKDGTCEQHQEIENSGNGKKCDVSAYGERRTLRQIEKSGECDADHKCFTEYRKTA